ncbi:MAG: hypothetical protein QOH87_1297 [Trebonia sp.]|jgi:hypothetical protein|nr:hypothetical protein [Trebonia sp.]
MPVSKTRRPPVLFRAHAAADRALRLASAVALLGTLSGCQGIVSSPIRSQVRIIDASPDATGLDMHLGSNALAYNLGFGTITSYIPLDPGTFTVSAKSVGTAQVLTTAKGTFAASGQYTVLIGNVSANLTESILKDQNQAAPSGQIALRFISQATRVSGLDVYLVPSGQTLLTVTALYTNLTFGVNSGYLNVPTGTYTLVIVPTGTVPSSTSVAAYTGSKITYTSGSARTIVLIDQHDGAGLKVITAADYDSPTAAS